MATPNSKHLTVFFLGTDKKATEKNQLFRHLCAETAGFWVPTQESRQTGTREMLARSASAKMLFDGPSLVGGGIRQNVDRTVEAVGTQFPSVVTLCGHSRGAVECFIAANVIRKRYPSVKRIRVFALDPVARTGAYSEEERSTLPGGDGGRVSEVDVLCLLARDEGRRGMMFPWTIPTLSTRGGRKQLPPECFIELPGTHGTMTQVGFPIGNITLELGRQFLLKGGVAVQSANRSNDPDLWMINEYCRIHTINQVMSNGGKLVRVVNDNKSEGTAVKPVSVGANGQAASSRSVEWLAKLQLGMLFDPSKPFINKHHMELWRGRLPATWSLLSEQPLALGLMIDKGKLGTRKAAIDAELNIVRAQFPDIESVVGNHFHHALAAYRKAVK